MYIPAHYKEEDQAKLLAFMQANSFALLVSHAQGLLATHLPFVATEINGKVLLRSHMAKANPQWKELGGEVLVVFQGPHAYISPTLYEKKENVPTWNYIAVHAYGKVRLISEETEVRGLLEGMIREYEKGYLAQYKELPEDYIDKMIKGIVAFEIEVDRLQGKRKLSQNKTEQEQKNIIHSLENKPETKGIADSMKSNLK